MAGIKKLTLASIREQLRAGDSSRTIVERLGRPETSYREHPREDWDEVWLYSLAPERGQPSGDRLELRFDGGKLCTARCIFSSKGGRRPVNLRLRRS